MNDIDGDFTGIKSRTIGDSRFYCGFWILLVVRTIAKRALVRAARARLRRLGPIRLGFIILGSRGGAARTLLIIFFVFRHLGLLLAMRSARTCSSL